MVIQHRERTDRLRPAAGSLEVHLPEFVGSVALEPFRSWTVPVLLPYQVVAQQDVVNRAACQREAVALKQNL